MSTIIRFRSAIAVFVILFSTPSWSQLGFCPPNMDFELGDFTNWTCRSGRVTAPGGVNTITWTATGQAPNQHTIVTAASATDAYGNFPQLCPNGSGFSAKLGNETAVPGGVGNEATGISYVFTIPPGASFYSIFFHYAVVLENPSHLPEQQPRFRARIRDLSSGSPLPCVNFDFTASSSLPGFQPSPIDPQVLYKDWTPVTLNLTPLAGRTVELEFIVTECTQGGHFGYAYVDVNSACNGAISGTTICQGDNSITLTAPYGFQSYRWFDGPAFGSVIGTTQTLPLNPAPAVGTVIPVEVTPYPGFGCLDTLYATITVSPKPASNAGADASVCKYQSAQLGAPPNAGLSYSWTPTALVSNPNIANPIGSSPPPGPTEFIVKTTDILTGCFTYDTAYIYNKVVDTAIRLAGNAAFCDRKNEALLSLSSSVSPVQWYDGANPIAGATSLTYQPTVSGNYWAQVQQNGCTDSTATIGITVHPLPVVSFAPDEDTSCVTKNLFSFANNSTVSDLSALSYTWIFGDGSTSNVAAPTKTFTATGTYTVKLIATSANNCQDSTSTLVYVLPNGQPYFTWDSICANRPVTFTNLSRENGSALTKYQWTFNDGGPGSSVKNPPPVIYTGSGRADVKLQLISLGCENDPKEITRNVQVNPQHKPVRYRDITVPEGSRRFIHVRDSIGEIFRWSPPVQLTNYYSQYTEFIANGTDILYLIDITDPHTCVTTDTILMQVLKKPGYYLPSGFTPNGDGLNDVVRPYLVGMKALKSFSVFNRWGQLVFFSTKEGEGWDGRLNGDPLDSGVYVWMLEFYNKQDQLITEKGTITLIR